MTGCNTCKTACKCKVPCKKECNKCPVAKCICPCPPPCCCDAELDVSKKILTACQRPGIDGATLIFIVYEITLFNRGGCRIVDLGVQDSLAGLAVPNFALATFLFQIQTCGDSLYPISNSESIDDVTDAIKEAGGQLLDTCKSYIDPCQICKINLLLRLESDGACDITHLLNGITVTGNIEKSKKSCNGSCTAVEKCPIKPISVYAPLLQADSPNGIDGLLNVLKLVPNP